MSVRALNRRFFPPHKSYETHVWLIGGTFQHTVPGSIHWNTKCERSINWFASRAAHYSSSASDWFDFIEDEIKLWKIVKSNYIKMRWLSCLNPAIVSGHLTPPARRLNNGCSKGSSSVSWLNRDENQSSLHHNGSLSQSVTYHISMLSFPQGIECAKTGSSPTVSSQHPCQGGEADKQWLGQGWNMYAGWKEDEQHNPQRVSCYILECKRLWAGTCLVQLYTSSQSNLLLCKRLQDLNLLLGRAGAMLFL